MNGPIRPRPGGPNEFEALGQDIYSRARPYLVEIGKDAIITSAIYALLFFFELLSSVLPLRHTAGDFFEFLHSVALFALFAVFSALAVIDVIRIHKQEAV